MPIDQLMAKDRRHVYSHQCDQGHGRELMNDQCELGGLGHERH